MGLDCHFVPAIYSDRPGDVSPSQARFAQLGFLTRELQAQGRRDAVMAMKGLEVLPVKVGLLDTSSSSPRTLFGVPAEPVQELLRSIIVDSASKQPAQTHVQSPGLLSGSGLHHCHQDGSSHLMQIGTVLAPQETEAWFLLCVFPSTMANDLTLWF